MDELLQKFIAHAPVAVMARALMARAIGDSVLDDIFERHAEGQYTRELTFSTVMRLMTQVVFRTYPSVNAAYRQNTEIPVSITSVYNKLNGLGTEISQALVAETAGSMSEIVDSLPGDPLAEPIEGLRLRILDGNVLAGTEHRLACLRDSGAAALPGMSLVVRNGCTGPLTHLLPCEDSYTNERTLHTMVLPLVQADDLWLADRNFCTDDYMSGIEARGAYFVIRHHAGTKLHPVGPETNSSIDPGQAISEQRVRAGMLECRCVIIRLEKPLRDGTTEIRLLTNAPLDRLSAKRAAEIYRTRWRIESAFQELTESLRCEINTLGYPKAALLGFALAVVAYNLLVVNRLALVAGLGEEVAGVEVLSSYYMATEAAAVDKGMSIALAPSVWRQFVEMTVADFALWLYGIARGIDWRRYHKRPRGPKKPVDVKRTRRGAHRSTARELDEFRKSTP
jgi:hypothetical protein